jgi:hypothetical protein
VKHWKKKSETDPRERNVVPDSVVDAAKVFLPQLHIKLGLIQILTKLLRRMALLFISAAEIPPLE